MKKGTWKQKSIKKCVAWLLAFALVLPLMSFEVFADTATATERETLDPTLENITFGDFPAVTTGRTGVYGRYEANKSGWVLMAANNTMGTLSGKVLNGNVIFGSHPFQLRFGGDIWGANGYSFRFYRDRSHGEGELGFDFGGDTGVVLTSEIAQTELVDSEFNLKLSFEEEDTDGDGANELKLGIWFNNVLYNNTYFYAESSYDTYLNPTICSYGVDTAGTSSAYFVLKPSREQTIDPALTWFTFSNCGVTNGTYTGSGFRVSVNYNPGTGWDNAFSGKVLNGKVTFTSAPFRLKLGKGSDNGIWSNDMICLYRDSGTAEGALKLNVGNTSSYTLTPEVAGTALIGQELNLKVSFQEIDSDGDGTKDQLKVGIWFNNYLYGDKYFYVTGEYLHCTYGWLGFYGDSTDASITLSSCKNTLDPSLKQFTYSDFNGGADGTYSASTGWSLLKEYFGGGDKATAFSGKVLNGYVTFGTGPSELRFGGDMWSQTAFRFYRDSSSKSDELYFYFNGTRYTLTSDIAGTDLVGKRFNLKISFQEIDANGDGTKDRLKVGLWFEDVLYNDTYFYVDADYSKFITGVIYVYGPNCGDGGYVKLTSYKEKEDTTDVTKPIASVEVNAEITDSIAMNYSVTLAEGVTETPTMTFAMAKGETLKNIQGEQVGTSNTYTFTYPGVMAQNMANTITAKVTVGTYTGEYNYSVLDYCGKLLTTEEYSAYRDLVVNLVQYGEAVQEYRVSKDMENAPAETLTEQLSKLVPEYAAYDKQVATTLEGVTDPVGSKLSGTADTYLWKNVTLVLGNKIKIRARFTANGIEGLTVKAKIGSEEQTLIPALESEGVYRVDFDKIYANEYAESIAITFCQEDQAIGQTLNYSVNSYLSSSSSTEDTYLSDLLVAINNFGNAAVAYKQDSASAAQ